MNNSKYLQKYWPYWIVEIFFLVLIVQVHDMSAVDLITLGLAASFVGRAVAYLKVFEWLRDPFVSVAKHQCGIPQPAPSDPLFDQCPNRLNDAHD